MNPISLQDLNYARWTQSVENSWWSEMKGSTMTHRQTRRQKRDKTRQKPGKANKHEDSGQGLARSYTPVKKGEGGIEWTSEIRGQLLAYVHAYYYGSAERVRKGVSFWPMFMLAIMDRLNAWAKRSAFSLSVMAFGRFPKDLGQSNACIQVNKVFEFVSTS